MRTCEAVTNGSIGAMDEIGLGLTRALEEIFVTMFNTNTRIVPHADITDAHRISSIVGFTGLLSGLLCLHFSSAMACNVASGLLGMPLLQIDDTVRDAVGELSNMVAGGLKKHLSRTDEMFKIAIPSVIEGTEYSVHAPADAHQMWLGVSAGTCQFKIQLVLEHK